MDEIYIGSKESNKNKISLNGFVDKIPIIGMKERSGKIIANVNNNTRKVTII